MNTENVDLKNPRFSNIGPVNIENLDFKKSEIFKHLCFQYSPIVNTENVDFKNPRFLNIGPVNIENWDLKHPRFSNIRLFDIHYR